MSLGYIEIARTFVVASVDMRLAVASSPAAEDASPPLFTLAREFDLPSSSLSLMLRSPSPSESTAIQSSESESLSEESDSTSQPVHAASLSSSSPISTPSSSRIFCRWSSRSWVQRERLQSNVSQKNVTSNSPLDRQYPRRPRHYDRTAAAGCRLPCPCLPLCHAPVAEASPG